MGLHRLFREEETLADLPINEALRDQLEDFDLPGVGSCSSSFSGAVNGMTSPAPLVVRRWATASKRREWSMYRLRISLRSAASTNHVSVACGEP